MWRRARPLTTAVLAAGLVLMRRRLRKAQAELERLRAELKTAATAATEPVPGRPETAGDGAVTRVGEQTEVAAAVGDLSSEWEQAVPPMDS